MIALIACALLSAGPPADVRSAVALMGQRSYARRERGEMRLRRACLAPRQADADEARNWTMAAATTHADTEVRYRALRAIRYVEPCGTCYGSGRCWKCPRWDYGRDCECKGTGACGPCRGSGTGRLASWMWREWPR